MAKRLDDMEMVDVLCGEASADLRDRVHASSNEDPAYAERFAQWEHVAGAVRAEKDHLADMNERVIDGVMSTLRFVEAPERTDEPAPSRRGVSRRMAVVSAACSLAVVVAFVVQRGPNPLQTNFSSTASGNHRATEDSGTVSDLALQDSMKMVQRVESVSDLSSLQKVIDATPVGGHVSIGSGHMQGNFVFDKPMTIVSHDGPIVIGRS